MLAADFVNSQILGSASEWYHIGLFHINSLEKAISSAQTPVSLAMVYILCNLCGRLNFLVPKDCRKSTRIFLEKSGIGMVTGYWMGQGIVLICLKIDNIKVNPLVRYEGSGEWLKGLK